MSLDPLKPTNVKKGQCDRSIAGHDFLENALRTASQGYARNQHSMSGLVTSWYILGLFSMFLTISDVGAPSGIEFEPILADLTPSAGHPSK